MNLLNNTDYYEILDIPRDASPSKIRQARQSLLTLYKNDPVVADSFFNLEEKERIVEAIETAFAVLSDPEKKAAYDQTHAPESPAPVLGETGPADTGELPADKCGGVVSPLLPDGHGQNCAGIMKNIEASSLQEEAQTLLANLSHQESISGQDIHALRKSLDLSADQVFAVTRINSAIIQSIEENRFEDLPPAIYLKSFLKNYAQVLCLDPDKLADGYLKHMDALKEGSDSDQDHV